MDITTLNKCLIIRKQIAELYEHRKYLYDTVHSPSFSGAKNTEKSSPVEKAFNRLQKKDDQISQLIIKQAELTESILDWLYTDLSDDSLERSELRRIIICHYIDGMSWTTTTKRVLGHYKSDSAKQHVYRYFKSHPEG